MGKYTRGHFAFSHSSLCTYQLTYSVQDAGWVMINVPNPAVFRPVAPDFGNGALNRW
jgi:hypothetical protein